MMCLPRFLASRSTLEELGVELVVHVPQLHGAAVAMGRQSRQTPEAAYDSPKSTFAAASRSCPAYSGCEQFREKKPLHKTAYQFHSNRI